MNMTSKSFLTFLVLASVLGLAGCKQEGTAEKAGQKVGQAIEQTGKKMDQAGEAISEKGKKAGEYIDDATLTAKVMAEIASDPLLKGSQISVTTNKGVVRLSGVVDSQQGIDRALEITRNINGIQVTENNLAVKSAP